MNIKMIKKVMIICAATVGMLIFAALPVCAETVLKEGTTVYTGSGSEFHLKSNCGGSGATTKTTLAQALNNGYTMCKSCAEEIGLDEATRSRLSVNLLPYRTPGTISTSSGSSSDSSSDSGQDSSSSNQTVSSGSSSDGDYVDVSENSSKSNSNSNSKSKSSSNSSKSSKSSSKSSNSSKQTTSGSSNSGNSSSGKELMTQKQRRNRFMSKTNPKRNSKPVSQPKANSAGFSYAYFGTYNSYNSDNSLGGTPIYLLGTVMDMAPAKESGSLYSVAVMVNDSDGYQWYMRAKCDKSKYELFKKELMGKSAYIYGTYAGYSGVTNRPMMDMISVIEIGGSAFYMSAYQ